MRFADSTFRGDFDFFYAGTAQEMGIASCALAAFDPKKLKPVLGLEEHLHPDLVIALGYAAHESSAAPFEGNVKYYQDENGNAVYSNKPVPVQLAYPAGTNSKSGFTLYIVQDDGELKTVKLTKKESHLVFHLPKGFSEADLVLAWKKSGSGTPETGDTASLALWLGLALLSLAGIAVTGIARRKLKREN